MRIAFATCAAMPDGNADDHPVADLVGATYAAWDDSAVDWSAYDRVVLRSVWDYTTRAEEFIGWCRRVGAERLRNVPDLVAFNADKRYLAQLAVPTVPTTFVGPGDGTPALTGEVVVKPNVSAGARDTGRFGPAAHAEARALIAAITASGRTALVQPYLTAVDTGGETALVHFGGALSHVLRKRAVLAPDEIAPPALDSPVAVAAVMLEDDLVVASTATEPEVALGRAVVDELTARFGTAPLYARVDMVAGPEGSPVLMEVEAVEPHLYLGISPGAAERFAAAITAR